MQQPIKEDFYKTLKTHSSGEYKEKGSKFLAFAYPVRSIEEVKGHLDALKKEFYDARHHCFGYRINPEKPQLRSNDDGEPSNSAGAPIFNQLQSFELWNVVVFVVRYFGGTKLGVSGLIHAYKEAAYDALNNNELITEYITTPLQIRFPYKLMNEVSRFIKDYELEIVEEQMGLEGGYLLAVRKNNFEMVLDKVATYHEIQIL
jgi:uncharacterized YigZ family protein